MAGKDKAMRAFLRGATSYGLAGLAVVLVMHVVVGISGRDHSLWPSTAECVLWIAPWLLVGGLLNLAKCFKLERRIQFSIKLLLLITLLISFSAGWCVLAYSRYRSERHAIDLLRGRCYGTCNATIGPFFPKILEVGIQGKEIEDDTIPFVIENLKNLPFLSRVVISSFRGAISEKNFLALKAAFPDIEIVQEQPRVL